MSSNQMGVAELFHIDVTAELRHLGEAVLQGEWQVPAELVRDAVRRGGSELTVGFDRHGCRVRATGAAVDEGELEALATALDPTQPSELRHRAIVNLEQRRALVLLWAATVPGMSVMVTAAGPAGRLVFRHRPGRPPDLVREEGPPPGKEIELCVEARDFDTRRARSWLSSACRFVQIPLSIDGRSIVQGFPDALFQMRISHPLAGIVGVAASGDSPRLWLLQHGVLTTRATIPGYPPFQAAIELHQVAPLGAPAAEVRRAVTPYLPELIDHAVEMLLRLGRRIGTMGEDRRQRVVRLLLHAARLGLRNEEVYGLKLLLDVGGASGSPAWRSLDELRSLASRSGSSIRAIHPDEDRDRFRSAVSPTLVLSSPERAELVRLLDVRLEPPPVGTRRSGVNRWLDALRELPRAVADLFMGLVPSRRPVAPGRLTRGEEQLVTLLGGCVGQPPGPDPVEIRLAEGGGRPRWRRGRRPLLVLPRRHPDVVAAIRALNVDVALLYPVALGLLEERSAVHESVRQRWQNWLACEGPEPGA